MAPGSDEAQPGRVRLVGAVLVREGDRIPGVALPSTAGGLVDLAARSAANHLVLFSYPGDETGLRFPELRGCTAEACSFRDHVREFAALGTVVYGISLQTTARQRELVAREHLSFELLSDANRALVNALGLPVWSDDAGAEYVSRVTLVVARGGRIARLFPEVKVEGHIQEVLGALAG